MSIELVPLVDLDIVLADPIVVGDGPRGHRLVHEIVEARMTGERLNAVGVGNAAADWVLISGRRAVLDVRATFRTDDGAIVLVTYGGRVDFVGTDVTEPGAIYVAPTFETGDERYAWLNSVQAVGKGRLEGHDLHYEWHEVR